MPDFPAGGRIPVGLLYERVYRCPFLGLEKRPKIKRQGHLPDRHVSRQMQWLGLPRSAMSRDGQLGWDPLRRQDVSPTPALYLAGTPNIAVSPTTVGY